MQLTLNIFPRNKPSQSADGKTFLLRFGGWQWMLAKWGTERQDFYTEGGDYLGAGNEFEYAELPDK